MKSDRPLIFSSDIIQGRVLWYTYGRCLYSMPKGGTVQKVVNFIPFKKPEFLSDYNMWYGEFRMDMSLLEISAFFFPFYRRDTQQRQISLCLLVCLKKYAFSSDEWLFFLGRWFFFRKVIATFSATEIMAEFVLSLAAKNIEFVLSAHDGV